MSLMRLGSLFSLVAGTGLALAVLAGACSGDSASGSGGSGPTGSSSGSTGEGGAIFTGSGTAGGGGFGGTCASSKTKAEQAPLDMYIMLDQSGSMDEPAGSVTKWEAVTKALEAFVKQPGMDGISIGLQYFGLRPNGSKIDSCDASDYAKPEVAIAPLPGVADPIIASMADHHPSTDTPTAPALDGAIQYSKTWATAHPDHVTITVLATDGNPYKCDTNLDNINAIAAAGVNGTPKILTFVIGVGLSVTALNGIAAAGGTGQAFIVDASMDTGKQFLDALNKIRGTVLTCSYAIPLPQDGTPDYGSVNVEYTPGDGGAPEVIPKVNDAASCPTDTKAWYYDDNAKPTQIVLCEETCNQLMSDTNGAIDIVLGCATVTSTPR